MGASVGELGGRVNANNRRASGDQQELRPDIVASGGRRDAPSTQGCGVRPPSTRRHGDDDPHLISKTYRTGPLPLGTRTVNIGRQANGAMTSVTPVRHDVDRPEPIPLASAGPWIIRVDTASQLPYTRAHARASRVSARERRVPCVPQGAALGRVAMHAKRVTLGKAGVS